MEKIRVKLGADLIDEGKKNLAGQEVSLHEHTYKALLAIKFKMTRVYETHDTPVVEKAAEKTTVKKK